MKSNKIKRTAKAAFGSKKRANCRLQSDQDKYKPIPNPFEIEFTLNLICPKYNVDKEVKICLN